MEQENLNMNLEIKDSENKIKDDDDLGSLYVTNELFFMMIDDLIKRIHDNQS